MSINLVTEKLKNLTLLNKTKYCSVLSFDDPTVVPVRCPVILGVDPGRNYGLTILVDGQAHVYAGKFNQQDISHLYGVAMAVSVVSLMEYYKVSAVGVEGAIFGDIPGQVGLAEIRYSAYLAAISFGIEPEVFAPMSARKLVFGFGKVKGSELWPTLNPNGADSLVIALARLSKI